MRALEQRLLDAAWPPRPHRRYDPRDPRTRVPGAATRRSRALAGARSGAWRAVIGESVKIVVGLGNPGDAVRRRRATTSAGWSLDRLADRAGWTGRGRERDALDRRVGRYRGLDLTLVKPLTFMNDSGLAVRKVLAREHAPLADLLVVADDFALPFGKLRFREGGGAGGHNGLRLDHRRARQREVQPAAGRDRRAGSRRHRPRPDAVRSPTSGSACRSSSTRRPTRSRPGRATGRRRPPTASTCSSCGRPTRPGSRRRARSTGRPMTPASAGRRPAGAKVLASDGDRHVDRGVVPRPLPRGSAAATRRDRRDGSPPRAGSARRQTRPLRAPARCLAGTGSFAEPPRAADPPATRRAGVGPCRRARHVGLPAPVARMAPRRSSPRRWPAPATDERLVWIARDAEIGDRRGRGAGRLARRPGGRRRPRAADGPGLRAQRARRRRDGRPGRRARGLAERACPRPRGERPGAPPAHDRPGRPARRAAPPRGRAPGSAWTRSCASCSRLGYAADDRGRRPGRVRPARRHRRRVPAVGAAPRPDRVLRRRDRLAARPSTRPTSGPSARSRRRSCCPRREFLAPAGGAAALRDRLGRAAAKLPERLAADLARFEGGERQAGDERPGAAERDPTAGPRRALDVGDAAEVWAGPPRAGDRPRPPRSGRRSSSSTSPATSPRPPPSCGARPTSAAPSSSRAATCRRTGRSTYLGPRDWKGRLVAGADARADLGVGAPGPGGHRRPAA